MGLWDRLVPGGTGTATSGGTHGGKPAVDIFAPAGTPIFAPVSGISLPAFYPLGGNATTIKGDDGRWYYLAHGQVGFVGGRVAAGQQIGRVGNTGNAASTPSHLHFAVASLAALFDQLNGSGDIDPEAWARGLVGEPAPPSSGEPPTSGQPGTGGGSPSWPSWLPAELGELGELVTMRAVPALVGGALVVGGLLIAAAGAGDR